MTAIGSRMEGICVITSSMIPSLTSMECEEMLLFGCEDTSLRLQPAPSHVFQAASMGVTSRFVDRSGDPGSDK